MHGRLLFFAHKTNRLGRICNIFYFSDNYISSHMSDSKKNDEIDLSELFLKAIITVKANFLLILLFFFIGLAVGLAYYLSSRKVFENKMIISSAILTESYGRTLIENTNRYIREGNNAALASQLYITEVEAREINSLKIETLTKSESEDQKESERLLITAEVFDQNVLPKLQHGIVAYFENNEFAKVRVEQNKSYFKEMLARTENEIKDLEQFKFRIFNGDFFQSSKGNVMFDPTIVNSKILELTEKKIGYQNALRLANSVQVIDGFTRFEHQTKPKLSVSLTSGSLVGLFFVGMLIVFKSVRRLLRMAETANQP